MTTYEEHLAIVEDIFGETPPTREERTRILWEEARAVKEGVIVELGTYLGRNAIMMALAATVPVYTVDDYLEKRGRFWRDYGPEDREWFEYNVYRAGVNLTLVEGDAREVAETWDKPVSLLYWDLAAIDRLEEDLAAWAPHVTGKVFVHDRADRVFGVPEDSEYLGGELWLVG